MKIALVPYDSACVILRMTLVRALEDRSSSTLKVMTSSLDIWRRQLARQVLDQTYLIHSHLKSQWLVHRGRFAEKIA